MPSSSAEAIAKAANLNERYVREWLGAVVTGGVVEYDAAARTYFLPQEHAGALTRAAGPNNLAAMMQFVPLLGMVEQGIVTAFRQGGGVPYSEFPGFQTLMREISSQVTDATLIDVTLPLVPGVKDRLEVGIDVADVGCGAGHAINLMARRFPKSRFLGYDFSEDGLAIARTEAQAMGVNNATFVLQDAAKLDVDAKFDFVCVFDAVHDQARPAQMLGGIYRMLKSGGDFLCVDIAASSDLGNNLQHPGAPFLYSVSTMHCMTVSLAYGGDGLGTMWGEEKALEMFGAAGFKNVSVNKVEGDHFNNYYVAKK